MTRKPRRVDGAIEVSISEGKNKNAVKLATLL